MYMTHSHVEILKKIQKSIDVKFEINDHVSVCNGQSDGQSFFDYIKTNKSKKNHITYLRVQSTVTHVGGESYIFNNLLGF